MLVNATVLPKFVLEMKEMKELLNAETPEIERLENATTEFLKQLIINETDLLIERYEKIFDISGKGLSLEERRKNVLTKKNMTYSATKESIINALKEMTGLPVELNEIFEEYRFTVDLIQNNLSDSYIDAIRKYLDTVKPAHLGYVLSLIRYEETTIYSVVAAIYSQIIIFKEVV